MDAREIKAMQIAATMPLRRSTYGWEVPSQSGIGSYKVSSDHPKIATLPILNGLVCSCPDYELRRQPCKHILAVEMTVKREYGPTGEVVSEEVKITYTQDWAAYNKAQCEEKDRFMPMLADLCSTIADAPQGRGRPTLPKSDMAFAAVSKIYGGMSARRSDSDVREAASKGLTSQDPHFNSVLRYLRSPEMTPILRSLVELSALPLKAVETDFAADATGFSTCRFVRWYDHKWGSEGDAKSAKKREWVKLHAMTGVRTNIVTAVEITDGAATTPSTFARCSPRPLRTSYCAMSWATRRTRPKTFCRPFLTLEERLSFPSKVTSLLFTMAAPLSPRPLP
jgi:SWIM zinc finger